MNLLEYFFVTPIIIRTFASEEMKDMKRICGHRCFCGIMIFVAIVLSVSCEVLDNDPQKHVTDKKDTVDVALDEVAHILSAIPLHNAQLQEVHTAVTSSMGNGYDEEYTMKNLFASPGSGVGDSLGTDSKSTMHTPLRELIEEYVRAGHLTKAGDAGRTNDPEAFLKALEMSDVQIYWPYSEEWDGEVMPVITFDPEDDSDVNIGYEVSFKDDGSRYVKEVVVDEEMAKQRPVWVVNRNSDAGYTTLEMLRREDPDWGEGGGSIIVKPNCCPSETKAGLAHKMLMLKEFAMNQHYDCWFAGASEFAIRISSLDDFTASTEAELRLYNPQITDFVIVVKRNQLGKPQPFNVVLVSDMKRHLIEHHEDCDGFCTEKCQYEYDEYAFMMTEDDGGTQEEWTCKAKVFVAGKSYGVEVTIPLNSRDDIVWRGMLTGRSIANFDNKVCHFGNVDLMFEIVEY